MPELEPMPISNVLPSPPIIMRLVSFPLRLSMTSTPEATAEAFSKRECSHGTHQELSGNGVVVTSRHPVGETTMVLGPAASKTSLMVVGIAHPAQALCPGASKDFSIIYTPQRIS